MPALGHRAITLCHILGHSAVLRVEGRLHREGRSFDGFNAPSARTPTVLARTYAGLCIPALAVLSWTPGAYMIRTGVLSGHQEHFLAYLISGCLVAAASRSSHYAKVARALCSYAALLELGQYFIPGRHPAFQDFSASSLGALMGIGMIAMIRRARLT